MPLTLYYSVASPYARKCRVAALEAGLGDRLVLATADQKDAAYHATNPLARVPALVTEDGMALFDSPVICEYLDSLNARDKLFPPAGPARWSALKRQAIGDGIMDWAVPLRQELLRPAAERSPEWMAKARANINRTLDALEAEADSFSGVDIGAIAIACALGYLDFRFAEDRWRDSRPKLARWQQQMAQRPSLASTAPDLQT